ncbi:MAG TPA: hypothetical protein PLB51_01300 [Candidatus Paceibacterota bacterium]|nr:hypothetical protein [Candidatus Paceibacterota bacterium]
MNMKKTYSFILVLFLLVVPVLFADAQTAPQLSGCRSIQNVDGLVSCALSTLKVVIYFLFSFAFIYTLYGAFRFIGAEGDSRDKWRDVIVYGIIGLFVMTSIWGLVGILDGTFGLSDTGPIKPPEIRVN